MSNQNLDDTSLLSNILNAESAFDFDLAVGQLVFDGDVDLASQTRLLVTFSKGEFRHDLAYATYSSIKLYLSTKETNLSSGWSAITAYRDAKSKAQSLYRESLDRVSFKYLRCPALSAIWIRVVGKTTGEVVDNYIDHIKSNGSTKSWDLSHFEVVDVLPLNFTLSPHFVTKSRES